MREFKVLFPIVFGIAITFGILSGFSTASSQPISPDSPVATIIYVDAWHTTGIFNGNSWATAYNKLQDALDVAVSGDQIWVTRGVYRLGFTRNDSFDLVPGVALYGGFDLAFGADEFSERDWEAYRTVLSGDIGKDDTDTGGVVVTTTHIVGDNSYHVVRADGTITPVTSTTVLDGFIITAGQANGDQPQNRGGGFYCDGSAGGECSPSLSNIIFSGNFAINGGAQFNHGDYGISSPTLTNMTFSGNSADEYGGALVNNSRFGISSPALTNVTFTDNSAGINGGAIFNRGYRGESSTTLTNVTFSGNLANEGGGMFNNGNFGTGSPSLVNVTFSGNTAGSGGGMYNDDVSPSLANVTFSGNAADKGGALFNDGEWYGCEPSLNNLILWGNTAVISGNQVYNHDASLTITTSLVQEGIFGAGVYNEDSSVTDGGGNVDADPDFLRNPDPGPDGSWDGVGDNYGDLHLQVSSPAIDSGANSAITLTVDLDGNPRTVDGDGNGAAIVDMGAYEFNCPAGEILYVNHTASGSGSSWLEAKPDLALGLKLIGYCPNISEIWVARGIYTPGIQQSDSFDLVSGLALYGGFDPAWGVDEFSERDWKAYPTILSGDIDGDDIHTDGVVMTTTNILGSNSFHVVRVDGTTESITSTTVLDGFTITAGQANFFSPNNDGGGFYCDGFWSGSNCSPSLANLSLSGNWADDAGGAMHSYAVLGTSSPTLSNVHFSGNSADGSGGAISFDCTAGTCSPTLTNVTFSSNSVDGPGGAMANYCATGTCNFTLANVAFTGNSADDSGGAMYNNGEFGNLNSVLNNVSFSSNSARLGGAMYNKIIFGASSLTLTNATFSGNSADYGGAMYNYGEDNPISPGLSNLILWGNTAVISGSQMINFDISLTLTTSLVQAGIYGGGVYNENSPIIDGGGNIDADPDFVRDPDPGPDGNWDGVGDDYGDLHLLLGSPAIDTGTNSAITLTFDLDGNSRFWDGDGDGTAIVDMGAYENHTLQLLIVIVAGDGSGTVTGVGVDCSDAAGGDCTEYYPYGSVVTLSASADPGSTFIGWSGACTNTTGDCVVTMDNTKAATASFDKDVIQIFLPLISTHQVSK